MEKAKIFTKKSDGPVGVMEYCIEGLHAHVVTFLGAVNSRRVTVCDGTCKEKPAIQELEFKEEALDELREQLGKEPTTYPPPM